MPLVRLLAHLPRIVPAVIIVPLALLEALMMLMMVTMWGEYFGTGPDADELRAWNNTSTEDGYYLLALTVALSATSLAFILAFREAKRRRLGTQARARLGTETPG